MLTSLKVVKEGVNSFPFAQWKTQAVLTASVPHRCFQSDNFWKIHMGFFCTNLLKEAKDQRGPLLDQKSVILIQPELWYRKWSN